MEASNDPACLPRMYLMILFPAAAYTSLPVMTTLVMSAPASLPALLARLRFLVHCPGDYEGQHTDKQQPHASSVPHQPAPPYTRHYYDCRLRQSPAWRVHVNRERNMITHVAECSEWRKYSGRWWWCYSFHRRFWLRCCRRAIGSVMLICFAFLARRIFHRVAVRGGCRGKSGILDLRIAAGRRNLKSRKPERSCGDVRASTPQCYPRFH